MTPVALLLSLPVSLVGVWYLLNPSAATRLLGVEEARANVLRVRLRRVNGAVMVLTGLLLYLAVSRTMALTPDTRPGLLLPLTWIGLVPLLTGMVVLAWLDVRLTRRLRRDVPRRTADAGAVAIAFCLLGSGVGCGGEDVSAPAGAAQTRPVRDSRAQDLPTVDVRLGEQTFRLQIAATPDTRETGLMYRTSLAPDEGMLFVFPDDDYRGFWMKNTFVPLDIAFLDADRRVLNTAQMMPRSERMTYSRGMARYVIEVPLDTLARVGVRPGIVVDLPDHVLETDE